MIAKPNHRREKAAQKRAQAKIVKVVRSFVFSRDKGRCRVCRCRAHEMHELRFRSLGGQVCMANSIAICRTCHTKMQTHRIAYQFASADEQAGANGLIHFTEGRQSWVG